MSRPPGRNWMGLRSNGDYTVAGFSEIPLLPALAALVRGRGRAGWRHGAAKDAEAIASALAVSAC